MKTLREFREESVELLKPVVENVEDNANDDEPGKQEVIENSEQLEEGADVELKPHSNGTHYIVHKIGEKSGIEPDQLKVGEKISDTHVDDLHDMGYRVKIHKK